MPSQLLVFFDHQFARRSLRSCRRRLLQIQRTPELTIAMLACARIGAIHSIVFGAFSSDSLRDRINDSLCKAIVTQDTGVRGTKTDIPMKVNADKAMEECKSIEKCFVVRRTGTDVNMQINISITGILVAEEYYK